MTKANSRKNTGNKTQRFSSTDEFVSVEALIARLAQMDADDENPLRGARDLQLVTDREEHRLAQIEARNAAVFGE